MKKKNNLPQVNKNKLDLGTLLIVKTQTTSSHHHTSLQNDNKTQTTTFSNPAFDRSRCTERTFHPHILIVIDHCDRTALSPPLYECKWKQRKISFRPITNTRLFLTLQLLYLRSILTAANLSKNDV